MISNTKDFVRYVVFSLINIFIKPSKKMGNKSLLLIRLDAIGDYILFRNYIELIKKSDKYKDYSITLLGNSAWKAIANELDSSNIDNFIWLDRKKFLNNFLYRYEKIKEIVSEGYELVISPVFSREFFYADSIVKMIQSDKKIGSHGDNSNIKKWQKRIGDSYYDLLIPVEKKVIFEFERNREFFNRLLEYNIEILKPEITNEFPRNNINLPENYAVLFIGASNEFRKWPIESYAKLGHYIKSHYSVDIVLCGAPDDRSNADLFGKYFEGDYVDLVGKTTLLNMFEVIKNANILVSNETSIPHIAVALDVSNVFVIYNGNHYTRFIPYPSKMASDYFVINHPEIEKDLNRYEKLSNSYNYSSRLDISEISYELVKEKIDLQLKKAN